MISTIRHSLCGNGDRGYIIGQMLNINPRRAGGLDFPWSAGGGAFLRPPPSNSAPELRSDMRQAAFESSSKISKKVLRSF